MSLLIIVGFLLNLFYQFQSDLIQPSSLVFIPPREIQETTIPTTIDWIYSHYTSDERSIERNKNWFKQMIASGVKCEMNEETISEDLGSGNRILSYVDCFQVPIYLKEYYLPRRNLRIKEPAIPDWRSKQYDQQRTGQLVTSGNFLYSHIYDSKHLEKQEISDHNSKDFSFFFMIRYDDTPPYQQIAKFINDWSQLAYPKENTNQFIVKVNTNSKNATYFEVYKPQETNLKLIFHYLVWCSSEKKQCLIHVNNQLLPILGKIRTNYFGEIVPFDKS